MYKAASRNTSKSHSGGIHSLVLAKGMFITSLFSLLLAIFLSLVSAAQASEARLKDIVNVEGVRENMLIGYGLVVGLNGTGDKLKNNAFTEQSLIAFLERQGVNTRGTELKSKNVAAVTVTGMLPGFARAGSNMDVNISAMGDAKSLQGGTLLATPLYGADGEVYAVAQGALTIGGFEASGDSASITKGVPTNGFIANGAIVEREVDFNLNDMPHLNLALRNPDVTTANNVAKTINEWVAPGTAIVSDPGTVKLLIPTSYTGNVTGLLADIERLPVDTDQPARIVVDEASGTIVMGENVRLDTVAVAQGNLIVKIEENPLVSQPLPLAPEGAETLVVPQTSVEVKEEKGRLALIESGATLKDMVTGLNALGVGPRDLITILQTIKSAGALQADIEVK